MTRLLNVFYNVVLLIILPLVVLHWAAETHFAVQLKEKEAAIEKSLSSALFKIEPFRDDRRFFHSFLQKKFNTAEAAEDNGAGFYAAVKKIFGGRAKVINCDENGNVIAELSDEKRFGYLMKKMVQAVHAIKKEQSLKSAVLPSRIELVSSNIELLRRYFGEFLTADVMDRPLRSGLAGEALFVSNDADKGFLWYQAGKKFSVICILHSSLKGKHIGLETISRQIESAHGVKTGYFSVKDEKLFAPWLHQHNEFLIEKEKFTNASFYLQKGKDFYWHFRQASPDLFIFSAIPRETSPVKSRYQIAWFLGVGRYLLIILFVAYCASLRYRFELSMRLRLVLIVGFSTGLPLLLLISSCYEYFNFQKTNLIFQRHNQSMEMMRELDRRYLSYQNELAESLNQFLEDYQKRYGNAEWQSAVIDDFKTETASFSASEYLLVKPEEGTYFTGGTRLDETTKSKIDMICSSILSALNKSAVAAESYGSISLSGFANEYDLTTNLLKDVGKISERNLGGGNRMTYMNFLGDRNNNRCWAFLVMTWDRSVLQELFLDKYLARFNEEFAPGTLLKIENSGFQQSLTTQKMALSLQEIYEMARRDKFSFADDVIVDGKSHIVSAMSPFHLDEFILAAAFPSQPLFIQIYHLAQQVAVGAFLVALTVLLVALRFSTRMFSPLIQIREGLVEIQKRNFRKRLNVVDESELGELAQAVNKAIESMADLSLGTSVQAALLPPAVMRGPAYEIHSEVRYMTSMGGDFCDYYEFADRLHIAFGDVAGHGIPAALIMAMVKAFLPENRLPPGKFLENCNEVFLYLLKRKWRRMMTLASLQVCLKTGKAQLANAGHCYPILIDVEKKSAEYIVAKGMPLGSRQLKEYEEVQLVIRPGCMLLFYSDGFIEDTDQTDTPFGFENFLKLVQSLAANSPAELIKALFMANNAWTKEQKDDLSLLCVRYTGND
ncbi:MAG: hypothetical protein GQF41_3616 [Candidatus Rifleibacterium amylolyticum]|nr:MAG: hypothetical protein GQF41_3616 [Candidatus Rifleibacterium amylolyticum]